MRDRALYHLGKVGRYLAAGYPSAVGGSPAAGSDRLDKTILMGTPLGPGVTGPLRQEAIDFCAHWPLSFVVSRALAARRNPDLLAERARFMRHEDAKPWDKILAPLVGLGGGLIPLIAGLDELLNWSPAYSLPVKIIALAVILAGFILSSYALIENRFFSGMIRIQTDRGQQVVSSGPYRWVRHPGYAGSLLVYLAMPFFLDTSWAILPAMFFVIAVVIRTRLEDQALQEDLDGYRDYAKRVRYRLLPGVW